MEDLNEPTRYARQQEKAHQMARHAEIARRLGTDIVERFYMMVDDAKCHKDGRWPSPWVDWDMIPEHREPYEDRMPTQQEARKLCDGCPLMQDDVCFQFAMATNKQHGVWGGRRIYNGHVVTDGRDAMDTPNRER
jgi:hypothetical protein